MLAVEGDPEQCSLDLREDVIAGLEAWMTLFYEVIDEDEDYAE